MGKLRQSVAGRRVRVGPSGGGKLSQHLQVFLARLRIFVFEAGGDMINYPLLILSNCISFPREQIALNKSRMSRN